jgi:hypothetical protein
MIRYDILHFENLNFTLEGSVCISFLQYDKFYDVCSEHLISFYQATGQKPQRIIFYRYTLLGELSELLSIYLYQHGFELPWVLLTHP